MRAIECYFHVALFVMHINIILAFMPINIIIGYHCNELNYTAIVCDDSNETF